ncbi:hypothetical protein PFISCL1PPCAC_5341, partial [Pristionchus fissidentatus]
RFIGRRNMMLAMMILGVLASVTLMFPYKSVHHIGHLLLNICVTVAMLISIVNLNEMLPYETRYICASSYTFAYSMSMAIATNNCTLSKQY